MGERGGLARDGHRLAYGGAPARRLGREGCAGGGSGRRELRLRRRSLQSDLRVYLARQFRRRLGNERLLARELCGGVAIEIGHSAYQIRFERCMAIIQSRQSFVLAPAAAAPATPTPAAAPSTLAFGLQIGLRLCCVRTGLGLVRLGRGFVRLDRLGLLLHPVPRRRLKVRRKAAVATGLDCIGWFGPTSTPPAPALAGRTLAIGA